MEEGALRCEIDVRGHLERRWQEWLGGLSVETRPDGVTCLRGALPDQSALYGVLSRLRDLGITLIAVRIDQEKE